MVTMSDFIVPDGGYGRIWEKAYQGSLVGSGPEVFCVWPYVIANMKQHRDYGAVIMLNPKLLAVIFGEGADEDFVMRGIAKLCAEDPDTKNGKEENGRRLVQVSGFMYRVVNGAEYMRVRAKESHAAAQARYRAKKKGAKSQAQVRAENEGRERRFLEADKRGDQEGADRIAAEGLPSLGEVLMSMPELPTEEGPPDDQDVEWERTQHKEDAAAEADPEPEEPFEP